jgi:ABC-type transport system substrate-binding protein
VVVAVPNLPSNFNPSTPQGANRITDEVMAQVLPQAFVTGGLSPTISPGFVESAEVQGISPFIVVYKLNPKAVWSDGLPITAEDFIYNWHEQLRWAPLLPASGLVAGYRAISSISSSDGGATVSVTFKKPFNEWESLFSNLIPAHVARRYGWVAGFEGFDPTKVISGGPFEIKSYQAGHELTLARNPDYWFAKPGVAEIILRVESSTQALAAVQAGEVSVATVPNSPVVAGVIANAAEAGVALTKIQATWPILWQLCFNLTGPVLDSRPLRLAVEHSLYVAEIVADSAGLDDASLGPYGGRLTLGERVSATGSGGSGSGGSGSGSGDIGGAGGSPAGEYNPALALSDFREAGYVQDAAGVMRLGGTGPAVVLQLLVPSRNPTMSLAADVIQAQLSTMGVRMVIRARPLAEMLRTTLPEGSYQLALAPFLLTPAAGAQAPVYSDSVLPATVPLSGPPLPWASTTPAGTEPGAVGADVVTRDIFGLEDPKVGNDLAQALTSLNPGQDALMIAAAETQMSLDVASIPLFQVPVEVIHASDLRGLSESPSWAGIFWDAQSWAVQLSPKILPASGGVVPGVASGR